MCICEENYDKICTLAITGDNYVGLSEAGKPFGITMAFGYPDNAGSNQRINFSRH